MRFHWSNGSESLQSCQKLVSINVKKYTEASEACKLNIFTARTVRPQTASLMYDIRVDWPEQNAMIKSLFVCTSAIAHTNVMWSYQRRWRKNNPTSSQEREREMERDRRGEERETPISFQEREKERPPRSPKAEKKERCCPAIKISGHKIVRTNEQKCLWEKHLWANYPRHDRNPSQWRQCSLKPCKAKVNECTLRAGHRYRLSLQ